MWLCVVVCGCVWLCVVVCGCVFVCLCGCWLVVGWWSVGGRLVGRVVGVCECVIVWLCGRVVGWLVGCVWLLVCV